MKKIIFLGLIFAAVSIFSGCASAPSDTSYIEKKQSDKKLRYDDWKYMGFGSRIPDWVEPAIEGNLSKVRKMEPSLVDSEIIVLSASGMNIDQAEEALLELEVPEDYLVYETFWVRQAAPSDKPYIAVAIYRRK